MEEQLQHSRASQALWHVTGAVCHATTDAVVSVSGRRASGSAACRIGTPQGGCSVRGAEVAGHVLRRCAVHFLPCATSLACIARWEEGAAKLLQAQGCQEGEEHSMQERLSEAPRDHCLCAARLSRSCQQVQVASFRKEECPGVCSQKALVCPRLKLLLASTALPAHRHPKYPSAGSCEATAAPRSHNFKDPSHYMAADDFPCATMVVREWFSGDRAARSCVAAQRELILLSIGHLGGGK